MPKCYCQTRFLCLEKILLKALIGDSDSITFGDGLVIVKSQQATSQKSQNDKSN